MNVDRLRPDAGLVGFAFVKCSCISGEPQILKFISNTTESNAIELTWERYQPQGYRGLMSFEVFYKEA